MDVSLRPVVSILPVCGLFPFALFIHFFVLHLSSFFYLCVRCFLFFPVAFVSLQQCCISLVDLCLSEVVFHFSVDYFITLQVDSCLSSPEWFSNGGACTPAGYLKALQGIFFFQINLNLEPIHI